MKKIKTPEEKIKSHIKAIGTLVIGYGVGEFMGEIMKDFQPNAKGVRKLFIKVGALALTGMVIKAATDYVEKEVDEAFDTAKELMAELNEKEKGESDNGDIET